MNKNNIIFIDDLRFPREVYKYLPLDIYLSGNWYIVRNYIDFTVAVESYYNKYDILPSIISFDHDLADFNFGEEKTGYDCAKWLVDFCIDNNIIISNCIVHTMNPVGGENIKTYINNYLKYK